MRKIRVMRGFKILFIDLKSRESFIFLYITMRDNFIYVSGNKRSSCRSELRESKQRCSISHYSKRWSLQAIILPDMG